MANAPDTPAAPAPTLWNSLVKPAVVLVLLCPIVGFLLGSVDNPTLPTITANPAARAWADGRGTGLGRGNRADRPLTDSRPRAPG